MNEPAITESIDPQMLAVRLAEDQDLPFIFATWLRSYQRGSPFAESMLSRVYFQYHHRAIERVLARPSCIPLIATLAGDSSVIVGYLVIEKTDAEDIIHFGRTKRAFQGFGVMKRLVEEAKITPSRCLYTHKTTDGERMVNRHYRGATYVPYLL